MRRKRSSVSEWSGSGMTSDHGSENASAASSNVTPCLLSLIDALRSSHSKSMYPSVIICILYI